MKSRRTRSRNQKPQDLMIESGKEKNFYHGFHRRHGERREERILAPKQAESWSDRIMRGAVVDHAISYFIIQNRRKPQRHSSFAADPDCKPLNPMLRTTGEERRE